MYSSIYTDMHEPDTSIGSVKLNGDFYEFDQSEFAPDQNPRAASLDRIGFVYVPSGCRDTCRDNSTDCKISIVFHGCIQGR